MKKFKYYIIFAVTLLLIIILFRLLFIGNYHFYTGRYIKADNGDGIIVMDNIPVVMSNRTPDEAVFDHLQTGDEIFIIHGVLAESYPAQTGVYFCIRLSQGDKSNVPENIMDELAELGWVS